MPLRRMDIESVIVGGGPVASLVVLRTREEPGSAEARLLPIRIGSVEASAISMGVNRREGGRPMTHDLLCSVISALGAKLAAARVMAVKGTTFFAQLELACPGGERRFIDARPSDAVALAVRKGAPIYADESVLETASMPDFRGVEREEQLRELSEFHDFVESLSPEDFNVAHGDKDNE